MTSIACAVLGCSLGLTLSVWGRKTHEVLMTTYLILALWLICPVLLLLVADSFEPSFTPTAAHDSLGMGRGLESVLPRVRTLLSSRQGWTDNLPGFPGDLPRSLRPVLEPGNAPNSRRRLDAGPTPGDWYPTTSALPTLSRAFMAAGSPRPVTRRKPGPVAGMASIEAVATGTGGLDILLRSRDSLGCLFVQRLHQLNRQSRTYRNYVHVSGCIGIIAIERECLHEPC